MQVNELANQLDFCGQSSSWEMFHEDSLELLFNNVLGPHLVGNKDYEHWIVVIVEKLDSFYPLPNYF